MGQVRIVTLDDARQFAETQAAFRQDHPGLCLTVVAVDGDATLRTEQGGMRVFWIYRGRGAVFLPKGYRTQEGDGASLPAEYLPEPIDPAFAESLRLIKSGLASVSPAAITPVRAILRRLKGESYVGDYAGELWKLDHTARPWSTDPQIERALEQLFQAYRDPGYSTKQVNSYESLIEGDQVIVCGQEAIPVRGRFVCLAMENVAVRRSQVSAVRRLRYLADTAGGCNPDFDPFRRLPLTWYYNYPGERGDGLNWVNSHVVNIPQETSPAHFHPPKAIGGQEGIPQSEMYLVLDPQAYQLNTWGRTASLITFADLRNLRRYEQHPLAPGQFVYIPPGTGHRGLDVFVNVLTLPGFKPHNEYYIDRDIRDTTGGEAPYNENLLESKNYTQIEELL
jgi:hypothetical protein